MFCKYAYVVLVVLCFLTIQLTGQEQSYTPPNTSPADDQLVTALQQQLKADVQALPRPNRKAIKEVYGKRTERIEGNIAEGHYLFDNPINAYFDEVLGRILAANPEIPADRIRLLISRYTWPNASCLGEGTLVFNVGLLRRLENEGQLAFILCHELAHYMADHVNVAIRERVEARKDMVNSEAMKAIQKQEYGRYDALVGLLRGMVYEDRYHSRLHESEADSLGMQYFVKTGYGPQEALRCMLLLDGMDEEKYPGEVGLRRWLDHPEYPFKERWIRPRRRGLSQLQDTEVEENSDSLKTHPDCAKRHRLLERQLTTMLAGASSVEGDQERFARFARYCDYEMVQSNFDAGNYGRSLFYAFQLLNQYPEDGYLRALIGQSFHILYLAQKEHRLNDFVEPIGSQKRAYKQVLQLIHNLRLSEWKQINYYFLQSQKEKYAGQEDYLYALFCNAQDRAAEEELKQYQKAYLQAFPKGKYLKQIKP
ncbi:MAG: M48 family metallopeptidase [Bacteroidota bacterium]